MEASLRFVMEEMGTYPLWVCITRDRLGSMAMQGEPAVGIERRGDKPHYIVDIGEVERVVPLAVVDAGVL